MSGLVSAIIPVFNRPAQIIEAVESVLEQNYRPLEIIVVDDGSTDETYAVMQELKAQNPLLIKLVQTANRGPGLAREAGRQLARGDYIQYLDSDDVLYSNKFELQVKALEQNPQCQIAYGKTRYRSEHGPSYSAHGKRTGERIDTMFPSFLASRWWNTLTPLYRRSVCDKVGPWLDLKQEEDWEYDARVAALGIKLCFVDEFVCEFRSHSEDRLSQAQLGLCTKLSSIAQARQLIYEHAIEAGMDSSFHEMQIFSRSAFHLARQCGAAGLRKESQKLFVLSRRASGSPNRKEYLFYQFLAHALGWCLLGQLCCWGDRIKIGK